VAGRRLAGHPGGASRSGHHPIAEDGDGRLWVGTQDSGLYRQDAESGAWTRSRHDPHTSGSLPADHVTALATDRRGVLWVGTTRGLVHHDPAGGGFVPPPCASAGGAGRTPGAGGRRGDGGTRSGGAWQRLRQSPVAAMVADPTGPLWVETPGTLTRIDPATASAEALERHPGFPDDADLDIGEIVRTRSGRVAIATTAGLLLSDESSRRLVHCRY
jgi:ligand-binding sensor domain-containing protein